MEYLTPVQLAKMSRAEIAERFNLLIDAMLAAREEIKKLDPPTMEQVMADRSLNERWNTFLRIHDRLGRPFAATAYCESGVKPIKFSNTGNM